MENIKQTEAWYRSGENRAVSPSKVKAYRESKEWYFHRYIKGEEEEPTSSFLVGLVVDHAFNTGSVDSISDRFTTEKGVAGKLRLTAGDLEKATEMARQLLATDLLLPPGDVHTQMPLYATIKRGAGKHRQSVEVCGLPDRIILHKDTAGKVKSITLIDLKTAKDSDIASDKAWYWTSVRYGYFAALAVYSNLLQRTYKVGPHQVKAKHIVVGKTARHGKYPIKLLTIPRTLIGGHWNDFVATAFAIKRETDWTDPSPTWQVLHDPADQVPAEMTDEE